MITSASDSMSKFEKDYWHNFGLVILVVVFASSLFLLVDNEEAPTAYVVLDTPVTDLTEEESTTYVVDAPMNNLTEWTKAVCNEENYCVDVLVTCNGDKVVSVEPLREGVYLPDNLRDPRSEEDREKLC